ncbi:MAG: ATP-binding protein [Peptoniphilaceae bacterium]|nr:ATP-binding protein [Peptoniphilaceae bacterium]MDY6019777.1 ATP-binding protein [Anaerococcus sp.]
MKKVINKYINILTILIFTLMFLCHGFFSFKTYIKAQDQFMENSLSFLLSNSDKSDFVETLDNFYKSNKNLSLLYRNKDGKDLYSSENFDKDLYEKLKDRADKNKVIKNLIEDSIFIYQENFGPSLVILKKENIAKSLNYFDFKYYFFAFMIFILFNNFFVSELVKKIILPSKKTKLSQEDVAIIKDLEKFFKNYDNKNLTKGKNDQIFQSGFFDVKNITDNMEEGFIFFNRKGVIEIINEAAKNMLDIDKSYDLENLFDCDDYKLALKETRLLSKGKNIDIKVKNKDIKLFIDPIFDGDDFSYIVLAIDNSETKRAELMRREFSANVSHELKSPLTSINGYAELIATGFAKDKDIVKFAQIIYKEGNRLLGIIDDILKLSKLDEKNFEQARSQINVRDVCNSCIYKFKNLSDKKSLTIENKVEDFTVRTNESLFTDLITNLYENAIKYNKPGGKISLTSKKIDNKYYLMVSDTGIGIKAEDVDRIFERFYVADKSRSRSLKSTGLGLSIVKHICDYLNYDIKVSSIYGEGSTFTLIMHD